MSTVAASGVSLVAAGGAVLATPAARAQPSAAAIAADSQTPKADPVFVGRSGADYMVDAIRQLHIDYIAALPGSSFRGLHESLINYGGDEGPALLTCLHEEASVAMAHGYAKVAGKPMAAMLHGVVGLQHASMAIYNRQGGSDDDIDDIHAYLATIPDPPPVANLPQFSK